MRYWRTLLVVGLAATAFGIGVPTTIVAAKPVATSATVTPYCGFYWGSLLRATHGDGGCAADERAGRPACLLRSTGLDMSGRPTDTGSST